MKAHFIPGSLIAISLAVSGCERREPQSSNEPTQGLNAAKPAMPSESVTPATAQAENLTKPNALLPIGAAIPNVTATSQSGEQVKLAELTGKPLVVYFYPKDDTPGCTIEAQEIRDLWTEIQATGAKVVGVSVDDSISHRAFAEKYELPFVLLPDTDRSITNAFGVGLKSGRARRVTFVFGPDVRLAKVFPDVTPKGHGREVVDAIRGVRG